MNYYAHDIDAYQKHTGHLSPIEHGAYLLMLQVYYLTEKPLPTGKALYRVIRAHKRAEQIAIDSVVRQFWIEGENGLTNRRADEEIARHHAFLARQSSKGKASAAKRWGNHGVTTVQPRLDSGYNHGVTGGVTGLQPIHDDRVRQIPDSDSEDQRSSADRQLFCLDPDPRQALWEIGVKILGPSARSIIGQAIKRVGEVKVSEVIGQMAGRAPAEPRSYFIKATQERGVVV